MVLSKKRKVLIDTAVAGNSKVIRTTSSTILSLDNGTRIVLAKHAELTDAGRYYSSTSGEQPPRDDYDPDQALVRRGGSTYITTLNGRPLKLQYLAADGQVKYTAAGRRFYEDRVDEYIVGVPVRIRGVHKNGRPYERERYNPW